MGLTQTQRWMLLGSALLLTLSALYLVDGEQVEDSASAASPPARKHSKRVEPVLPANAAVVLTAQGGLPDLARRRQQQLEQDHASHADLFQAHAWYVAPAHAPAALQAPVEAALPVVPSIPYQYMGQLDDAPDGTLVFLSAHNRVYSVGIGQVLDQVWRLDKQDGQALYLTYLPLSASLVLSKNTKSAMTASVASGGPDQPTDR